MKRHGAQSSGKELTSASFAPELFGGLALPLWLFSAKLGKGAEPRNTKEKLKKKNWPG